MAIRVRSCAGRIAAGPEGRKPGKWDTGDAGSPSRAESHWIDGGTPMRRSTDEPMLLVPRPRTHLKTPAPASPKIVDAGDWLRALPRSNAPTVTGGFPAWRQQRPRSMLQTEWGGLWPTNVQIAVTITTSCMVPAAADRAGGISVPVVVFRCLAGSLGR